MKSLKFFLYAIVYGGGDSSSFPFLKSEKLKIRVWRISFIFTTIILAYASFRN